MLKCTKNGLYVITEAAYEELEEQRASIKSNSEFSERLLQIGRDDECFGGYVDYTINIAKRNGSPEFVSGLMSGALTIYDLLEIQARFHREDPIRLTQKAIEFHMQHVQEGSLILGKDFLDREELDLIASDPLLGSYILGIVSHGEKISTGSGKGFKFGAIDMYKLYETQAMMNKQRIVESN